MYKLITKKNVYTIPKSNIGLLAMTKAMDLGKDVKISNEQDAIDFLRSIDILVEDCND